MRVLTVDDSASSLRLLRAILESEGIEVVQACDGVEALANLQLGKVDAIISDILMPRMDGYRLCQEIRHAKDWHSLPFLFYTATYTSPADEKLCYDLGADKYLRKPVSSTVLMDALRESISTAKERRRPPARLLSDADEMKEYSERLVCKLEEKNQELQQVRCELERVNAQLETRVERRTAELQAANEELELFAHSVSHDLRAPLNHIKGFIDILVRKAAGQLDADCLKSLGMVANAASRMREMVEALLELSTVSRGPVVRRPVDLSALAADVCDVLRARHAPRDVAVKIADGLKCECDQRLARVALLNLLDNAWKYTRYKAGAMAEFGKFDREGEEIFFVRDNGAGFDMTYADRLFHPLQRLHAASEFEGSGIGLATVRRIVNRHDGRIWAESVEREGATFYFTLRASPRHENGARE